MRTKVWGGYELDRGDPDVWVLYAPSAEVAGRFSAAGATRAGLERAAKEHADGEGRREPSDEVERLMQEPPAGVRLLRARKL